MLGCARRRRAKGALSEPVWNIWNHHSCYGCDLLTRSLVTPDQSTTFVVVGQGDFNISYVDGSSSIGDYFTDVFEIGGATLRNMTIGLGIETDISYGLVGVGYAVNEAIVGTTKSLSSVYPNLPVNMVDEGLINTVAYSLWLNDLGRWLPFLCWMWSMG